MDFSKNEVSPLRRYGGLGIIVALHVAVAYVVMTSLAHKTIDVIKEPVEAKIITEIKPPPPPPESPPPPPPKTVAPPPPFVPPPEVNIEPRELSKAPEVNTPIAPPAPEPFHAVPEAPPPQAQASLAPPGAKPVPAFADFNACKPEYPVAALRAGEDGTVEVQIAVGADGQVEAVKIVKSSGSQTLDRATQKAFSACKFTAAFRDGKYVAGVLPVIYKWALPQ